MVWHHYLLPLMSTGSIKLNLQFSPMKAMQLEILAFLSDDFNTGAVGSLLTTLTSQDNS